MQDNKYYVPTIQEFHVGLEYEIRKFFVRGLSIEKSGEFIKKKFEWHDYLRVQDAIDSQFEDMSFIIIPYLTKEDIEAEGFKVEPDNGQPRLYSGGEVEQRILYKKDDFFLTKFDSSIAVSILRDNEHLFQGYIKNKSEFRRILKMIEV
jgi:hypothetical protein